MERENAKPKIATQRVAKSVSVKDAAQSLQVSTATIRNWIKEGHLVVTTKGHVSVSSLRAFKNKHIGSTRLISRANKLYKTVHPDIQGKASEGMAGRRHEASLSESHKNREGIFYTPSEVISDMLEGICADDATFLDPCCGCGNFIIQALESGIRPENLYGFDTDAEAVRITIDRIEAITGYRSDKIVCADFLERASEIGRTFDYIYTNPPWGRKIPKDDKKRFAALYGAGNSMDTCSLFYFAAKRLLVENGTLGFLFPEAVLNIGVYEDMRRSLLTCSILRIKDYGRPFKGVLTKAYSIIVANSEPGADRQVYCSWEGHTHFRRQMSFLSVPKSILNVWATEDEAELISAIREMPHVTLAGSALWGLGIVTGNNSEYCLRHPSVETVPVYRGRDITRFRLLGPHVFINKDFSRYQQVAPISLYMAPEKIIYRFISERLVFFCDNRQSFILNSANLVVPDESFPVRSGYLAAYFSCDFTNWMFSKIFNTNKILRSDIETIPVFHEIYEEHAEFDESRLLDYLGIEKSGDTYSRSSRPGKDV